MVLFSAPWQVTQPCVGEPGFAFALFDGVENPALGLGVDDWADGTTGILGRSDGQAAGRFDEPGKEGVVQRLQHDGP